jgi:trk system potassium uptake protein TrkA
MHIIVVGGDLVGASFVALAVEEGHDVTLIEADGERAEALAERFDVRVLHASIGEGEILEEAGGDRAGALVATTHDDSANLMAMVLGRETGIQTLVTVVNEKHHKRLFDHLGVRVLVDPEVLVARHLYGMVCRPDVTESVVLPSGGQAFELVVGDDAPLAGRTVSEATADGTLPPELVVLWRYRDDDEDGKGERVDGDTRFRPGDRFTVFSSEPPTDAQLEPFGD